VTDRLTAIVHGRVQGVGFRYFVRRHADALGLVGTATNRRDGCVEIVVEGARASVAALLDAVRGDAAPGFVGRVETFWSEPTGEFSTFRER
jgi:acylphosphatase